MKQSSALAALAAGFILLGATPALAQTGNYCTLPGERVAEDATGDAGLIGVPDPTPGHDVLDVFIGETVNADGVEKVHFTLKVDSLPQADSPLSSYQIEFTTDDGVTRFALYTPYPAPVAVFEGQDLMFAYGHNEVGTGGTSSFVIDGAADAESSAAGGVITIVLRKEALLTENGGFLSNVAGVSQINFGGAGTIDVDTSDSRGVYEVRGGASCTGSGKSGSGLVAGSLPAGALLLLALAGLARRRN